MLSQQLVIGGTYRVKFKGAFERHGVCTTAGYTCLHKGGGVFRLEQISSFRDVVLAGIKLYEIFFEPLGISRAEYEAYFDNKPKDEYVPEYVPKTVTVSTVERETYTDPETKQFTIKDHQILTGHEVFVESGKSLISKHAQDQISYGQHPIYKFVDVFDAEDIVYAPELALDGFPEIDISEYKDLSLVFHIGYFDKPELLDPMLLSMRERMATYGLRPLQVKLYSTGKKWLSPSQYEDIKSLRLPCVVDSIPEDATLADYIGKVVIINGLIKTIVDRVEEGKADEQVAFDTIKSGKLNIDMRTFMAPVPPGMVFDEVHSFYQVHHIRIGTGDYDCYRPLRDTEVKVGAVIVNPVAQPTPKQKPYYKQVFGDYVMLGANEDRDPTHAYDPEEEPTPEHPDDWYYWVKTTKVTDGGPVERIYSRATKAQINEHTIPLYRKLADQYALCNEDESTHTIENEYVYSNYLTQASLRCIGNRFSYTDAFGQPRARTLELVDLIDISDKPQYKNVTLIYEGELTKDSSGKEHISEALRARWSRYAGRAFKFEQSINDGEVGESLIVIVPEAPTNDFIGKTGEILGQNGVLSKELNFVNDTSLKRNYYMQYVLCRNELNTMQARYAALEKYVTSMANKVEPQS